MSSMSTVSEAILQQVVERLIEPLHPQQIYLFGSHAYGTPHRHSDLDILVVVADDAGDRWELAGRGRAALLDLPFPADILGFHRSEMDKWAPVRCSLPYTVVQKGRLLYAA